jgi:hypothetical protein
MAKFHEKNQAVFIGLQTGSGGKSSDSSWHAVLTSDLPSTTAVACTSVTGDPTRETGSYAYLGDSLSRDEYTFEKDKYIDLQLDTFQTVLATMGVTAGNSDGQGGNTSYTVNKEALFKLFQVCGGACFANDIGNTITVTNASDSPDYATVDYRKSTPDDSTNDKLYKFWDLRGSVDVTASVGEVPSLKFSLKGNAVDPTPVPKQPANFGTQTTRVANSVLPSTIKKTLILEIDPADAMNVATAAVTTMTWAYSQVTVVLAATHGFEAGDIARIRVAGANLSTANGDFIAYCTGTHTLTYHVKGQGNSVSNSGTITGATITKSVKTSTTFCFSTLTAPNFFGFDYQRYTTGCDQGFAKGGVPTDVTVSMLEDQANAPGVFLPDVNTAKFFAVVLKFGGASNGTTIAYMWDKLQLANVKQGKIASYLARDCSFRNTGNSYIIYE